MPYTAAGVPYTAAEVRILWTGYVWQGAVPLSRLRSLLRLLNSNIRSGTLNDTGHVLTQLFKRQACVSPCQIFPALVCVRLSNAMNSHTLRF